MSNRGILMRINVIGAGKLGKTIAKLLYTYSNCKILGICNRSTKSALDAISFIGEGNAYESISDLPPAEITIISTPDDMIQNCCTELSESKNLLKNSIVFHCSGSLSSSILQPVKSAGCYILSIHPMRSFANPNISFESFKGTFCAIEGDEEAKKTVSNLFDMFNGVVYSISGENKALYHAAGSIASNYLVTLAHIAIDCLLETGVNEDMAYKIVVSLMRGTINNIENTTSVKSSLTGPIKRGDVETVKKHLDVLSKDFSSLYKSLGSETLKISELTNDKQRKLSALFRSKL